MTSAFYWRDVNRRGCASSRQRRFNCATSSTQLPAELTDFNKLLSLQKLKSKKKKGKKKEKKAINCSLFVSNTFITPGSLVYRWSAVPKKKREEERKIGGPSEERRLKDGRLFRTTRKLKSPPCRFLGDEMNFITDILQTGSPEKGTTKLKGINFFSCNWLALFLFLFLLLSLNERDSRLVNVRECRIKINMP